MEGFNTLNLQSIEEGYVIINWTKLTLTRTLTLRQNRYDDWFPAPRSQSL